MTRSQLTLAGTRFEKYTKLTPRTIWAERSHNRARSNRNVYVKALDKPLELSEVDPGTT